MVETFAVDGDRVLALARAGSLQEASAGLPDGAYTTLRTYGGGRLLRLAEHVRRLNVSTVGLGHPGTVPEEGLRRGLLAALACRPDGESRLRVTFAPPRLFVSVEPFDELPAELYRNGVRCVAVALRRRLPWPKDTRFIALAAQARRHLPPDTEEGLMLGEDGALLEGLSSNFFAVRGGELFTDDERVLPGITRGLLLEVAQGVVPIVLRAVRLCELAGVDESFLTSASRGVLPVRQIDRVMIAGGRPGPITQLLGRRLAERIEREAVALS
jgi:branched-chain amino acid aminotransferase